MAKKKSPELKALEREREDLEFMRDPNKWPHLLLPLKKRKGSSNNNDLGLYFGGAPVVYIGNMFSDSYKDLPKVEYASLEALAEEWTVD